MPKRLNYQKLVKDIIDKRFNMEFKQKKRIGIREISKEIGISAPTFSRVIHGGAIEVDTLLAICGWLKKDINLYIKK